MPETNLLNNSSAQHSSSAIDGGTKSERALVFSLYLQNSSRARPLTTGLLRPSMVQKKEGKGAKRTSFVSSRSAPSSRTLRATSNDKRVRAHVAKIFHFGTIPLKKQSN
jgi:hypothetical protein